MTSPYCGIKNVPNEKHRGSMTECGGIGGIRYYGLKKVDKRLSESIKLNKGKKLNTVKLYEKKGKLSGKIKTLKDKIRSEKDAIKKDKMKDQGKRWLRELKELNEVLKANLKRT